MAVLKSRVSGNLLTAGTWGVVDTTSYNSSETNTTALTTSYAASTGFTPGAITVEGIALKLSARTGTSGTMSVHLAVAAVETPGTLVTIDVADLPAATTAEANGGWTYLKFAAPVTLAAATLYTVEARTSVAAQVSLFASSGSAWARALVTSTPQVPAAADDMIVAGDYTGPGTGNNITVTMNALASAITDYGNGTLGFISPALMVAAKGTLTFGSAAATNYYLRLSGNAIVYAGGTLNMGTVATPIPRDSTAFLNFDCVGNADYGLTARGLGTIVLQGLSRTAGKNVVACKLTADAAVNATSLSVNADTGWLDNDQVAVLSNTRTAAQCEIGAMNGNAGASTLPVDGFGGAGGGLAFAHGGVSPVQSEVVLLTRNVAVFGSSSAAGAFLMATATATCDCDWAELRWMGSATAARRGVEIGTTTGSCTFTNCSRHSSPVAASVGFSATGTSGTGNATCALQNCVVFDVAGSHFQNAATSGAWLVDGCVFAKNSDASAPLVSLGDVGGTFTNNVTVGAAGNGVTLAEVSAVIGTFSGNSSHSNTAFGFGTGVQVGGTINACTAWRNASVGIDLNAGFQNVTLSSFVGFGNSMNIQIRGVSSILITDPVLAGDTTFATASGFSFVGSTSGPSDVRVENGSLGVASGIFTSHTQDVVCIAVYTTITFRNTLFGSSVEVAGNANFVAGSYVRSQRHDQTPGLHKSWGKYGVAVIDSVIADGGGVSARLTPFSPAYLLYSDLDAADGNGSYRVRVRAGTACPVSVRVRQSAAGDGSAYNGSPPQLVLRKNVAAGIPADVVLATAAGPAGAWETLAGVTAAITDDAVLSFVVRLDGSTGWVNLDNWNDAAGRDSRGLDYWGDGMPSPSGVPAGLLPRMAHVGRKSF